MEKKKFYIATRGKCYDAEENGIYAVYNVDGFVDTIKRVGVVDSKNSITEIETQNGYTGRRSTVMFKNRKLKEKFALQE